MASPKSSVSGSKKAESGEPNTIKIGLLSVKTTPGRVEVSGDPETMKNIIVEQTPRGVVIGVNPGTNTK
ncbi:hypothetical protein DPMN_138068 [Dreissena polymorpha]|uniref:Uncharacterized protein n=1 Tax=Dreissena polymorpha TaxID=45954 RepID=A0A9D4JJF8_DREPO|nr:hypothetical protein DPMN_138068 [Dreissena polymorpha]